MKGRHEQWGTGCSAILMTFLSHNFVESYQKFSHFNNYAMLLSTVVICKSKTTSTASCIFKYIVQEHYNVVVSS